MRILSFSSLLVLTASSRLPRTATTTFTSLASFLPIPTYRHPLQQSTISTWKSDLSGRSSFRRLQPANWRQRIKLAAAGVVSGPRLWQLSLLFSLLSRCAGNITKATSGRRGPAATHTARARLPLGTPRQSDGLTHSHIRIVPRIDTDATYDNEGNCNDKTPTFRSPSLQFPPPLELQSRPAEESTGEPFTQVKTFADMARRYHQKDHEIEGEQSTPGCVSLAGIVKLQPNRKKATGSWRPKPASDLGKCKSVGYEANMTPQTTDGLLFSSTFLASPPISPQMQSTGTTRASPKPEFPALLADRANTLRTSTMLLSARGKENSHRSLHPFVGDPAEQLFGNLPDPIRLHEQTGEFDGQVVFIGHPNRDISAHQWSSTSFQWVNIGRYAHSRGKVEGSLASDRLKGYAASVAPLHFFRLAAEIREKLIVENGRTKDDSAEVHRPNTINIACKEPSSAASSLTSEVLSVFESGTYGPFLEESKPTVPAALDTTARRPYLEDPFIASIEPAPEIFPCHQPQNDSNDLKGSLDFEYEFPFKPISSGISMPGYPDPAPYQETCRERRGDREEISYHDTRFPDRVSQSALREIDFGEEAASGLAISVVRGFLSQKPEATSSPEEIGDHRKVRSKWAVSCDQATRMGVPAQGRIVIPNFAQLQPTARSLFPPPGLTVANPHRMISSLNASAPPYLKKLVAPVSEPSVSEATVVNAADLALKFSDPDGLRPMQEYEIANGLGQQAPTTQSFKGPFFTDTKPTTSDPTVLLSIHVSEEEKLINWFRDGHRPARQQEYAKTLISAAASNNRCRTFGVIGQGVDAQKGRRYKNTPPFVRLYEGLSEYAEEYRNGSGRSYFTRAWKAPPPQSRDLGSDGNNSYYSGNFLTTANMQVMLVGIDREAVNLGWDMMVSSMA